MFWIRRGKFIDEFIYIFLTFRIHQTIQDIIKDPQCSTTELVLFDKARVFFRKMRASVSKKICKIGGYFFLKMFRCLTDSVCVFPPQIERIKEMEKKGIPIIYLPLHRSHLDYLIITWTLWQWEIQLPHIASGDNLNLSWIG